MIKGFVFVNWDNGANDDPIRYFASWEAVEAYHTAHNQPPPRHPDTPAEPWDGRGYRRTSGYKYLKIDILEVSDSKSA